MSLVHRLKPKHLELMLKIAETGKLQLAAQDVAISQPAASRILAEMEASLGSPLFDRHALGMSLTPEGQVFARHARVVLSELDTIEAELGRLRSGASGSVRIGAVTGPAVGCLMPALKSVLAEHPDLRVSVEVSPSTVLFRQLAEARFDFILGRVPQGHETGEFHLLPGRSEVVSLMVHGSHPLAGRRAVELAELSGFPWVIQEDGSPIREAVESAFHRQSVPVPRRVIDSSSLLVALAQIAEGQAIAPQTEEVQSLLTSKAIGADLVGLHLRTPIEVAPYFIIRDKRRRLSRAAETLLDEVLIHL